EIRVKAAKRLSRVPMYPFAALGARIRDLQAEGRDIIRLDIGSPDMPPPTFILEALDRSARHPGHHGYPGYLGTPALRDAIAHHYGTRFGVPLDTGSEILPLLGSKEGIVNMALAWLDAGDLALVPDPGYPSYRMGALLAGANTHVMPLLGKNNFLPDLASIPGDIADRARLMWLNYPNNPTGAVAPMSFLEEAVEFARRHEVLICHDAPYCEICFDTYRAPSLLQVSGAKDVSVEFNSLSKSHNMAGWRVGMAVGNATAVAALQQVKSNMDSGIFRPVQDAAVAGLEGDQRWMQERNQIYEQRLDLILQALQEVGIRAERPQAGLYIWAETPEGYDSAFFADLLLVQAGVSVTPGTAFGEHGEGYFRISLGQDTRRIEQALERLRALTF
ncbi:MAG TPA: LL-diaminopimelate aminotransferase, partial [Anaerolineae bacterium]|nr:LL-diaminopimelate aminotransferase [Anaerolineae bacterium]